MDACTEFSVPSAPTDTDCDLHYVKNAALSRGLAPSDVTCSM